MSAVDENRLRNWARGYQRLMLGGLGEEAHTVCVDDFADDEGEFPYITADDVLALLDELDHHREQAAWLHDAATAEPRTVNDAAALIEALPEGKALLDEVERLRADTDILRKQLGCDCGGVLVHTARKSRQNLVTASLIAAAEQRGREDNADHGQCYVHGSKALAARLAQAWDEGHYASADRNPYRETP